MRCVSLLKFPLCSTMLRYIYFKDVMTRFGLMIRGRLSRRLILLAFLVLLRICLFPHKHSHSSRNVHPTAVQARRSTVRKLPCSRTRFLGDSYGGWTFCVPFHSLNGSLVYTIGVGRNIEWDKAMIREYGTVHHGWDPTPTAVDFFRKRAPPKGFHFHRYGLGVHDGTVTVELPRGNHDSYTIMGMGHSHHARNTTVNYIRVRTVKSMMRMLGHEHLAVLKIDIEGAEFAVIAEWVHAKYHVPVDQILIEFHERYFDVKRRAALVRQAIRNLHDLGFEIFHRARLEISFIRVE